MTNISNNEINKMLKSAKDIANDIQKKDLDGKRQGVTYMALKILIKGIEDTSKMDWEMMEFFDKLIEKTVKIKVKRSLF